VLQGPEKGRRFELPDAPTLIGRESPHFPLTDSAMSRRHCKLEPVEGKWMLVDLGSVNGTHVNGVRIDERIVLRFGDQIRIGNTLLMFGGQPGVSHAARQTVSLGGDESMNSTIMETIPATEDSTMLAVPEPAAAAIANLNLMYELSALLGSSFDVQNVLEIVIDLVFGHMVADRGIILLADKETGQLIPQVVRTREDKTKRQPASSSTSGQHSPGEHGIQASKTIINYVTSSGEGVLSTNALTDRRFTEGASIRNLGIRSVLCVPIKSRKIDEQSQGQLLGVIYIDSLVQNYTYSSEQLRLLTAIGLQAGMAVQNAKLYEQSLQAERLAAIGETTAALSHSMKNILQALRGGSYVVESGLEKKRVDEVAHGWRIVARNLEKMYNLTMNLLSYSRSRDPKFQSINPRSLIDECIELIEPMATEKGITVVADYDLSVQNVPLDPDGMHQAIMNLIGNALDAVTPNEGQIRVACHYDLVKHDTLIEVTDNGSGIDQSSMTHLFKLFHSSKGSKGTGLGLAVTKKIVEEHQGTITVQSEPGKGTVFTITIPARQANP
jgi:signal transduction histidine kinase/pSer/pThr/pTyr-binding forkhead associated (FHA) protein